MITKGQKVKFIPLKDIRVFGLGDDNKEVTGVVTYINKAHNWFLAEYDDAFGGKLRKAFKFSDIGQSVRVCNGVNDNSYAEEKTHYPRASKMDRSSIVEYVAKKFKVMRELGVTPTAEEWDHLSSLDSETKVDAAARTIMKKRWAERRYK